MAIQFGENISNTLGRTLQSGQRQRQFIANMTRRLQQDAFNNKIRELAQRARQKRIQLDQERFDAQLVADALDRERQAEQDAINKKMKQAQIDNLRSLIENRGGGSGDNVNQGAVSIELQALTNELRGDRERLQNLRGAQRQVFDTGVVPSEIAGDFGAANPTDVLFSLTGQILDTQSEIERKQERVQQLKELAGTAVPERDEDPETEQASSNTNQAPERIQSSVFE